MTGGRGALLVNVTVKALLAASLAYAALAPDLPQFRGKAMTVRILTYPLSALIVPVVMGLRRLRRSAPSRAPYPHLLDALLVVPFLVDAGGNAIDLYNSTEWYDRAAHAFNWAALVIAFGSAVSARSLGRAVVAGLALGFGGTTHILWEIIEYSLMKAGSSGLQLTYDDTMQDLILSFLGSAVGAALTVTVFWKARLLPAHDQDSVTNRPEILFDTPGAPG